MIIPVCQPDTPETDLRLYAGMCKLDCWCLAARLERAGQ